MSPSPLPLGSSPRQARGIAARNRVYEEALRQFAEKGVAGTRVEDIVGAADVAWGTFFRYFPRKEDVLLEAAARHHRERIVPLVESGLGDPDRSARSIALELFLTMLTPAEHPPVLHGRIVAEVMESRERFAAILNQDQPFLVLATRIVAYGQERHEVRTDVHTVMLAGILAAGTLFPTIQGFYSVLRDSPSSDAADPSAFIEQVFGVAWRGLEPLEAPEVGPPGPEARTS